MEISAADLGLKNVKTIHRNWEYENLINFALKHENASLAKSNALIIDTGIFTGRSPKDKYFVDEQPSNKNIAWGNVNKPLSKEIFNELFELTKQQLDNKELFITDVFCGASDSSKVSVRFITELAWQAQFIKNMFINPTQDELAIFKPDFTVYNGCKAVNTRYKEHGMNSEVFIVFDIENKTSIIGGTWYAGEMKKGIFSMMNYWLPLQNKLPMHCSANIGKDGDTALFFGLSGTGKTTLSTDPNRALIGDDEHGWDETGVFNFEGGCYAKVINLDPKNEPEIYGAIKKNAILENVVVDPDGNIDFNDNTKTENTRVSYPINHIENYQQTLKGNHPKNIIFLTADAFGVLPPVSKLTKEQAMYYFLSGYTAKVAGTERGITEPLATFSACFGEAFLPLHPTVYAALLGKKIDNHNVNVYLVNTGWTGGSYGVGKRMSIKDTRGCINAILNGSIQESHFELLPIFNLAIPKSLEGVASNILNPINTWNDKKLYNETAMKLAKMFIENFKKYQQKNSNFDYSSAGPIA